MSRTFIVKTRTTYQTTIDQESYLGKPSRFYDSDLNRSIFFDICKTFSLNRSVSLLHNRKSIK